MDIYAPCALGATLNDTSIPQLKCGVVAGAANNQMEDEKRHGAMLREKGIAYAPDFLINAGGLINCYVELQGYDRERAFGYTEKIYQRTLDIFEKAAQEDISTHEAAERTALERIGAIARVNSRF